MHKITVPYLMFGNEKIEPPVGLSELLETAWTKRSEVSDREKVSGYKRQVYKNSNGRWVTKFERM